jgi:hypothetical protein
MKIAGVAGLRAALSSAILFIRGWVFPLVFFVSFCKAFP